MSSHKKQQRIRYVVYKADKSGLSAANNFYTHQALITKVKHGYQMLLTVKVKHGLVKFKPLTMSIGKITKTSFSQRNKKDIWTIVVNFKSLKQLQKETLGTLHLSVPIANIHNRTFKVWFDWGVSKVLADKKSALPPTSTKKISNNQKTKTVQQPINSDKDSGKKVVQPRPITKNRDPENNAATLKQLVQYQSPTKGSALAKIPLKKYPFKGIFFIFLLPDLLIVTGCLYYWRKTLKKGMKR